MTIIVASLYGTLIVAIGLIYRHLGELRDRIDRIERLELERWQERVDAKP